MAILGMNVGVGIEKRTDDGVACRMGGKMESGRAVRGCGAEEALGSIESDELLGCSPVAARRGEMQRGRCVVGSGNVQVGSGVGQGGNDGSMAAGCGDHQCGGAIVVDSVQVDSA